MFIFYGRIIVLLRLWWVVYIILMIEKKIIK